MKKSRHRKTLLRDLVRQRIQILYQLAVEAAKRGDYEYASRLGGLIRELSSSTRTRIPRRIKRWMCKQCNIPLIPGVTATVRLRRQGKFSYLVIRCRHCGWIHRRPYKKGKGGRSGKLERTGEGGPPREPRRDNRKEGGNEGGPRRDR
ncbi:MAG: ribonuclease P Rpr2/Rpp21/SNM1 subunit [Desulfurococcales archaeon]|nr:ribonuclease P Rpr2/Rpp21/SNM1 subunit [Desulfurococcales archaeon]